MLTETRSGTPGKSDAGIYTRANPLRSGWGGQPANFSWDPQFIGKVIWSALWWGVCTAVTGA